jgi:pilus assembly protein Flp/PilA
MLRRFIQNESGATAIEYGLIAALLFLAIVTGASNYANGLKTLFGDNAGRIQDALR